jgi:hypothetical protein
MALLRSESKATHCSASGLRAGSAIARSFRGSRAWRARRASVRPSGRGPRVPSARGSVPSARAVPGRLASFIFSAHAGARSLRVVGVSSARHPLLRGGKAIASGVVSRHNCVFSRTAGDVPAPNQPLLARGRLTRRYTYDA